jgi:uncharacterized protein involved in exopolysaccharide biosynthesis
MASEPKLRDYLNKGRVYRRQATVLFVSGVVLSVLIAFVWPPTYVATAILLPPTQEQTGFSVSSILRGLDLPGVRVPTRSGPEDIAVSVLNSRRVKETLVNRFSLQDVYGTKNMSRTVKALSDNSSFEVDENGVLIINVSDEDPHRASDLANAYVEELDRFNREVRTNKGRRVRIFIEERLNQTRDALEKAEQKFSDYQQEFSTVYIGPEQVSSVEVGARLFARQAALRVNLGLARQFATENSEEVRLIKRELDEVNREIASLPDVGLELARLLRELKIQEQVYALLSAQYEEARLDETRDVATLDVLDHAIPPEERAWPRRGLLILIGVILSFAAALGWIAVSIRRAEFAA